MRTVKSIPFRNLPGGGLVEKGLRDLERDALTEEALLVLIAGPRLVGLGITVREPRNAVKPYEHELYSAVEARNPHGAHSAYNALIGKIVSFAQALAQLQAATGK